MLQKEKLNHYFDGQVDQLKRALSLNFGVSSDKVGWYLDILPEGVLENLSEGKAWYYSDSIIVSAQLTDVTLSQITIWLYNGNPYLVFTASGGKKRIIPSWVYPKVLDFIVNNCHNINYIKINECLEVDGIYDTVECDWDNIILVDRTGGRIIFKDGEPVLFKCKEPTTAFSCSGFEAVEE